MDELCLALPVQDIMSCTTEPSYDKKTFTISNPCQWEKEFQSKIYQPISSNKNKPFNNYITYILIVIPLIQILKKKNLSFIIFIYAILIILLYQV